ncbi:hypothetical protein HMPREF9120_01420 [Neisseria sp. oral taxon 020 str. F0370]|nr:hypothetical protein HMPREF9120_01420 [Neisseria sp. oral taxon 020 str. F0370]
MVQKGVAVQIECHQAWRAAEADGIKGFDGRFGLALGGAESGKIVFACQQGGGTAHGADVERGVRPPCPARQQRRAHGRGLQQVAVAAAAGVEAGMEMRRDNLRVQHGNARGQQAVGAAYPRLGGAADACVEVDDLGGGVHAGVGAACGGDGYGFARNGGQRVFQGRLNGGHAAGLFLPAEKAAAVVSEGERPAAAFGRGVGHGGSCRKKGGIIRPNVSDGLPNGKTFHAGGILYNRALFF